MPFCPICNAEFRKDFKLCNTCNVQLVDDVDGGLELNEENVHKAFEGKELVPISRGTLDAVKETHNLLSDNRILSIILSDETAPKIGDTPTRMLLAVARDDLQASAQVLGQAFQHLVEEEGLSPAPQTDDESCPACGNKVPENADECPGCGLVIGKG